MRTLLYLILILASVSSCQTTRLPGIQTKTEPYVQLKTGQTYTGASLQRKKEFLREDKIALGDTSFQSKDVRSYSTGRDRYANVGRNGFVKQVAEGKINLYRSNGIPTAGTAFLLSTRGISHDKKDVYFIQPADSTRPKALRYGNLRPMIQPNTPEFTMLEKYRKNRVIARPLSYAGHALTASGVFIALLGVLSMSSDMSITGVAMLGAGSAALTTSLIIKIPNQQRLLKTVIIADKIDE